MKFLYISTCLLLIISFIVNRKKTLKALMIALKKFLNILPSFILMLVMVSISLHFIPEGVISEYLSNSNQLLGSIIALTIGSIALMPGFVAYPLSGILLDQGVSYTTIASFTTTLMMVGLLTLPVEKKYLGLKVSIIRNMIGLLIAIVVSLAVGLIYGEIM